MRAYFQFSLIKNNIVGNIFVHIYIFMHKHTIFDLLPQNQVLEANFSDQKIGTFKKCVYLIKLPSRNIAPIHTEKHQLNFNFLRERNG